MNPGSTLLDVRFFFFLGFRLQGLGHCLGLGFRLQDLGFRVQGCSCACLHLYAEGDVFPVQGLVFRI